MNKEMYTKKQKFINDLSEVIVKNQPNVVKVSYRVYKRVDLDTCCEMLLVEYKGGGLAVRNITGDSMSCIFREIGKYLDEGYYEELDDFGYLETAKEWEKVDLTDTVKEISESQQG